MVTTAKVAEPSFSSLYIGNGYHPTLFIQYNIRAPLEESRKWSFMRSTCSPTCDYVSREVDELKLGVNAVEVTAVDRGESEGGFPGKANGRDPE